jgi:hypothetical protein
MTVYKNDNLVMNTLLEKIKENYPEDYNNIVDTEDYKNSCNITKFNILQGILLKKHWGV